MDLESNSMNETLDLTNEEDDDIIQLESDEKNQVKGKRKRRLTSQVWSLFDRLTEKSIDGKQRCKCKKCGAIFICDSKYGTGNLRRHSQTCVRRDTRDIGQLIMGHDMSIMNAKFDVEKFRELLVAAIVMHDLPLSFVEYVGVRTLFSYLRSDVSLISRNTLKSDLLKMYKREKDKIKSILCSTPGMICLTSDLWTSITTDGYLALTVHFVDKDWVLQKRLLNFSFMPPPHSGVALSEKVYSILAEWEIEKKVFCVTLDNASANDVFVVLLKDQINARRRLVCGGEFFHLRCCAHILNLIVQDGLREIDDCVHKVRESIKYVRGSQIRKQKFLECVKLLALNTKKGLRQDVPTRWNSTFLMLESAIFYRRAFCHLELSDSNYKNCPNSSEWEKIEKITSFLAVFYDITRIFSGTKYPTANLYFPSIFMAYLTLKENVISDDEYMRKMVELMLKKFEKYWSEFNLTLALAVILDPRYKIHFVDWSYKKLYGVNSPQFAKVRDKLFSVYDEYVARSSSSKSIDDGKLSNIYCASGVNIEPSFNVGIQDKFKEFDCFESEEFSSIKKKSQLEQYLDEERVGRTKDLDILEYWRANHFRYPELASMARDILSIPVSTVASESAFSVGGRVLDQYRSSLKNETVEALICTRDWLFGQYGDTEAKLDELTEDIMQLDISNEESSSAQCSNSINNTMV